MWFSMSLSKRISGTKPSILQNISTGMRLWLYTITRSLLKLHQTVSGNLLAIACIITQMECCLTDDYNHFALEWHQILQTDTCSTDRSAVSGSNSPRSNWNCTVNWTSEDMEWKRERIRRKWPQIFEVMWSFAYAPTGKSTNTQRLPSGKGIIFIHLNTLIVFIHPVIAVMMNYIHDFPVFQWEWWENFYISNQP